MKTAPLKPWLWLVLCWITLTALPSPAVSGEKPKVINFGIAAVGAGGKPFVGGSSVSVVHGQELLEQEFKKDGIEIRWHFFKNAGPAVNEAYSNQQLDFAFQGDLPQLIGKAAGLKTKYILSSYRRGYFYLAAAKDSTAASVKDLRGRKVALHKGTCLQLSVARLLADNGLTEKDLKVFNMDMLTATSALANGELELAFGAANLFSLRDQNLVKLIYTGQEDDGKYGCAAGVTVTEEFSKSYPDLTQRVVTTLVKGSHWAAEPAHRQELYDIWARSGVPRAYFKEEWDSQDTKRKLSPLIDEFQVASYKRSFDDARKFALVRGKLNLDQWFDRSYLDKALAELKLQDYWKPEDAQGNPKR
ncbi:MAG: transporter substrate-binding protein [Proteobacteria bacterium]|nr:transporter substrate-binding protein [Pseudomonadota bacterium]